MVDGELRLSYAAIDALTNRAANLLSSLGLQPGGTVALSCPNSFYFPVVYLGALKAGLTVVSLNILLKATEIAYHLKDSGAKAYVAFEGSPQLPVGDEALKAFGKIDTCVHFVHIATSEATTDGIVDFVSELAEHSAEFTTVDMSETDTAVVLYTSGTSGQPKGAELTHRGMRLNALAGNDTFGADLDRPDVFLCVLPLFHSFAQTVVLNAAFAYGGTVVLVPRFDEHVVLELIARHQVTIFAGMPTMYSRVLEVPQQEKLQLRKALSGGAALPADVHHRMREHFGVEVLEGYGLSETCGVVSCTSSSIEPRQGSVGVPIAGFGMRLVDDDWSTIEGPGEIAVRSLSMFTGYRGRLAETAEVLADGWFRAGDIGRRDEDGYYYLVDRKKDLIIRGGFNVYPREIEEVLMDHPDVTLAAVIGIPDKDRGEEIKAVVVRSGDLTEVELRTWATERLAAYKYPRIIEFVDTMPLTASGKILKRALPR